MLSINVTQTEEQSDDKWNADIEILSQKVPFRIDTGAKCNTLTLNNYQALLHDGELKRSNRVLKSYSNHKLKPIAAVDLLIHYKNTEVSAEFEIVDYSQENVLSGATAEALGLVTWLDALQPTKKENKKMHSGQMTAK